MLISFIIVAYNAEKTLKECLNCLKNQDYDHKKIEVILVDSMSLDKTKEIMLKFKEKNDFKRVVIKDNPGKTLPCGWNVALEEVKGDAVLRVDAHTTFPENFITENVKEIKDENIVGGKCISMQKDNNWKTNMLLEAEESLFGCGIADFRRSDERKYVSTLAFAMYRKEVFDNVGKYNEKLARTEDNEMHYRMRQKGYKFLLSPNIVSYRYARSSIKDLIKQKYNNGRWIGITLKYCPKCFSAYHFIPLLFVLAIIFTLLFCFISPVLFYLLILAYGIFNIVNIILITIKNKFHFEYLLLPFMFFSLHFSYGFGTLVGVIEGLISHEKK